MLNSILKSIMLKPTSVFVALTMLFMSVSMPANAQKIELKAGTPVFLELAETVNGNNVKNGQIINFRVTNDVKVNGQVVIAAGTMAQGQVTSQTNSGLVGIPGEVTIAIKSVPAVDGTYVLLKGSPLSGQGQDKMVISIALTVLCLFGFLIKGGKAEIAAGASSQAYVGANTDIEL